MVTICLSCAFHASRVVVTCQFVLASSCVCVQPAAYPSFFAVLSIRKWLFHATLQLELNCLDIMWIWQRRNRIVQTLFVACFTSAFKKTFRVYLFLTTFFCNFDLNCSQKHLNRTSASRRSAIHSKSSQSSKMALQELQEELMSAKVRETKLIAEHANTKQKLMEIETAVRTFFNTLLRQIFMIRLSLCCNIFKFNIVCLYWYCLNTF